MYFDILNDKVIYYHPQMKLHKVMFSQACVKNSVHRGVCVSQHVLDRGDVWQTPPWADPWNAFLFYDAFISLWNNHYKILSK